MGKTWNRRVTATADGQYLQVDEDTTNPNPPGRSDSAGDITVLASDRPAQVNYLGNGVRITGIVMKDGGPVPDGLTYTTTGNNLRLEDNGADNTDYSYYLEGEYRNTPIRSRDPQIHNRAG